MGDEAAVKETKTYSEKVQKIIDEIKTFTIMDLKDLKEAYEETFDVEASAGFPAGMMMGAAAPAADAAEAEEPSSYNLVIKDVGPKKIQVIKAVRQLTNLGLKDAKALVDGAVSAPAKVKEGLSKEEAENGKKLIEEAGGAAIVEPVS
jgi:large subunit ribosomal protein L7/L12